MDKMTKEEAAQLLTNYQQWRKGRIDYFPVSPAKLSKAIEVAIENLNNGAFAETKDAKGFCKKHMAGNVHQLEQFGLDVAGSQDYMYAIMADFANSIKLK